MREFRMKVWLEAWLSEYGKAWCSMKIEKVNDNQIRCTLTREELAERQIKLSELAYGTEKAKLLFRDMMQQAAYEFGFEADDIPLMIEAIPLSQDTIILVITKVSIRRSLIPDFPGSPIRIRKTCTRRQWQAVEQHRRRKVQMTYWGCSAGFRKSAERRQMHRAVRIASFQKRMIRKKKLR